MSIREYASNRAHLLLGALAVAGIASTFGALPAGAASGSTPSPGDSCPRPNVLRTPEQVVRQHVAALASGDLAGATCDYAEDATVLLPGQVVSGRDAIGQALAGFSGLLGGAPPAIETLTSSGPLVLLTFQDLGAPCTIPDGADTYVVVAGRILAQTVHDTLQSAPGVQCPAAP